MRRWGYNIPTATLRRIDVELLFRRGDVDATSLQGHLDVMYPQRVLKKTETNIPAGTRRRNDVVLATMRCNDAASTSIRRYFNGVLPLGLSITYSYCHFVSTAMMPFPT